MMTILTYPDRNDGHEWTVAEAKAKFSELVERAQRDKPQTVSKRGRPAVVVVSAEEWARKTARVGTLVDFLRRSPLSGLELNRKRDRPRKMDL